jgi:hypothetical protein
MSSPREVIERARKGLRPRPDATDYGWAQLQARLEDAEDVPELPRVPAMVEAGPRWRMLAVAAVAIAAAVALWLAVRGELFVASETESPHQQAPDRVQEPERGEVLRPPASTTPEVGGEVPAPFAPDREPASVPKSRPRAKAVARDTLAAEVALLQRAKQALARGEAEAALAIVREHARTYDEGALAEERFATHVRALCALDRDDEARRVAAELAAAFPGSGVAQALRGDPCEKKE